MNRQGLLFLHLLFILGLIASKASASLNLNKLNLKEALQNVDMEDREAVKNAVKTYIRERGLLEKVNTKLMKQESVVSDLEDDLIEHRKMNIEMMALKPTMRHTQATTALFAAYGSFETLCAQGTVTQFIEVADRNLNSANNMAGNGFNAGIFTARNAGSFWFYFSTLIPNNQNVDLTFRRAGTNVPANPGFIREGNAGSRSNCGCNNGREAQIDNGMVLSMAVGQTLSIYNESPNNNCIRSSTYRYTQFHGLFLF